MKKEKKSKKVLTPEEKAAKKAKMKETAWLGFKDGIIPFFIQMGILVVVILEFVFVIANKNIPNVSNVADRIVGGEVINDPNILRLIYMILCVPAVIGLLWWSSKVESKTKQFWISLVAGIVAWQCIGECSFHFGLYVNGTFEFFPQIEGPQGLFLLVFISPVLFYANKKKAFPWFVQIFLLSFMCNWLGHFVIEGIAPMWPTTLRYHNPAKWPKIVGILAGLHGSLMLLYKIIFKAKTKEERLVLSLLLYTFVGVLVEGVFGVGGSLV